LSLPPLRPLSADLSVAPQLDESAMAELAHAGFKSVINNRPDHEGGPDQPTSASMQSAALAAGLAYVYQPVNPAVQSAEEVAQFRALVSTLPKPVVAFCRTGTRCGKLFQAAQLA
jgi:uncharacterized protein (TIGR01244 family)